MVLKVYSTSGAELREIEVADDVFAVTVSDGCIYYAIKNELANLRVGTSSTKTRSEVSGNHQKLYRQKGTGRARAGTRRSPTRVGGGIAFGPKPRDFSYHTPKKVKRSAIKSILSLKALENRIRIIEDFNVETGKTKELYNILSSNIDKNRSVLIISDDNVKIKRAGNNIPWLKTLTFNKLRAHDLFYGRNIVILETAIKNLNTFYSTK